MLSKKWVNKTALASNVWINCKGINCGEIQDYCSYLTWEMSACTKYLNIEELNYFSYNKLRVSLHSNRIGNGS